MMQQEHEDEVRTLRQEKYALQQKLQEAEVKWNHYITEQGLQVTMVNFAVTCIPMVMLKMCSPL